MPQPATPVNTTPSFPNPGGVEDPRGRGDFRPEFYPKANGGDDPPPEATSRNDRIRIEFRAVYYRLNCEYARLQEARASAESSGRAKMESECLRAIEKILILRDGLEDHHAAFGVICEPVVTNGYAMDLKFTFGDVTATGRLRSVPLESSGAVAIRLPPGIDIQKLTFPDADRGNETGTP
jgi:hypothetical protein